jgi:hypothetical protein
VSVFARSDVGYVAVPVASGGCGQSHRRPVDAEGNLVKVWELSCPQCGNYLRNDPLWGGMISEIPETPDEVRVREDEERRGQRETAAATSHALVQIADLPNGMATAFATAFAEALKVMNGAPSLPAAASACPGGHAVPSGASFCPECGSRVGSAPPRVVESTVVPERLTGDFSKEGAVPAPERVVVGAKVKDLENKSMPQLREIAQQVGAKVKRSRGDQIAEITAALLVSAQ